MKKLFLIATIAVAGLAFGKDHVSEETITPKESVVAKVNATKEKNEDVAKLKKETAKSKIVNFPMTFCDDYGCETMEVDTSIYTTHDVWIVAMWWLGLYP